MFLTKIRERQFAKNGGGTYNLSRAVLAGVLAAGCLMPGFAEAAELYKSSSVDCNEVGNTATIIGNISGTAAKEIYWVPGAGDPSVESCTINVDSITIGPAIYIYGGKSLSSVNVTGYTVTIKDTTFNSASAIYGGDTSGSGDVTGNKVKIENTTFNNASAIYGGYSASGKANENSVSISGGNIMGDVYGGWANSNSSKANENSVIISGGTINGTVYGGESYYGEANGNSVIISGGRFTGSVLGGFSTYGTAKDNKVILVGNKATYKFTDTQGAKQTLTGGNIEITGTVWGGLVGAGNRSGNEIHVYGSNTKVGSIELFDKLHFFIDDTMTFGETMLTIKGIGDDPNNVRILNEKLAVTVSGKPQASGDKNTITLVHNESGGKITDFNNVTSVPVEIGELLTGEGSFDLKNFDKDLVLTLKNITVNENGKSLVETRAAAAFVVNNMSDFMLGTGMEQAKAAAGGVTPIDEGKLTPFAAIGGSNMRYTTGSYVDVNGWNGAVGFAKQADKLLFGVAVEHGRGNYDSYLDNGVHASGDIKSTGGVIFGEYKLDNGVHYDAALRAGRVKSDYSSTATSYDESSAYYGFSLGGGKEVAVSDKATLDVYGRYYFSHTNGSDVSIATGEEIDFDAVNSHRVRIGGRYTTTLTEKSKAYAGLAWQYEFGGDAKAAINGYSAPTPSLQGHSAIVEAGYKLNAGKNLTLDFNLNGAMGKQRGIGGGIGAQWLF